MSCLSKLLPCWDPSGSRFMEADGGVDDGAYDLQSSVNCSVKLAIANFKLRINAATLTGTAGQMMIQTYGGCH